MKATKALINISEMHHAEVAEAKEYVPRRIQEDYGRITFSEANRAYPFPHNRSLFITTYINDVEFKRAFLDSGASINIITTNTFAKAGILESRMAKLGKRIVTINVSEKPFRVEEAHYSNAVFFTELSTDETPRTGKIAGVKLPKWEDIQGVKATLESSEQKRSNKSTSPPPKIVKDGPKTNKCDGDESQEGLVETPEPALECMQDKPKPQQEVLAEVNLSDSPGQSKPVFVSDIMAPAAKAELITLLKQYSDVFAWIYDEMLGLDPSLKTNGQIRVCVDFRDLNKACPKNEFPLPHVDTLVDSTAGHRMFSFMDGFSGYNQIKMAPEDAEKTTFKMPLGNFFYTVMPFGLKNAGATYQRVMTAVFHDMLHYKVEVYMDDLVVKSTKANRHLYDLEKDFSVAANSASR
ncbi:uncharacterized protein K02A2.6-like [Camellia sinensis]|uniref:uncharacterized protein K02A2.6-like n=1 Tax=Camellia sinensis TaxID=4442 RepID=UPI001035B539|nr:uncharacterized protein K02A2.6-like [Camellia sinensis]